MSNELVHHGIKNQKWGRRRYQNPDGSLTPAGRARYGVGEKRSGSAIDQTSSKKSNQDGPGTGRNKGVTNNPKETSRKSHTLSNDELVARIGRLEKEKRYSDLVKEQSERETGTVKRILMKAGENFLQQSMNKLVSKAVNKIFDKKDDKKDDKFTIDRYKDMDVHKMDSETIKKVANWYTQAGIINKQREALSHTPEDDKKKKD